MKDYIMNKIKGYVGGWDQSRKMKLFVVTITDTEALALRPKKNITQN